MANKTQPTNASVTDFINLVDKEQKRKDCFEILNMMEALTGEKPVMWGDSIVGFGQYRYKTKSGCEDNWFTCGFSPRKANISLYLMGCDIQKSQDLLDQLGKHKTGVGCLYINKLADVNTQVLKEIIKRTIEISR
ncbi:hypothetical protein AXE80_12295 [Wenyingzhuangia fucanilytica]|uniref:YdhG-like domain-containing protein n=1 Tax=Wenyingzhuangia fucanilytica TaxID=1790137 RepID=A0A1B1Y8E1_9FLAO|nr:DUF1801 domain-containing protein [Wenyingzhuangia fucanilytica]ANW97014.1 hypothetical protein AXE80_12295 [Wenyingzhuangia fucanilytica]